MVSWNVGEKGLAGLAAARDGGLRAVFEELGNPAIIALQETKLAGPDKLTGELANVAGYTSFFSYCTAATGVSLVRTGYAGTGTYVRHDVTTLAAAASLGAALTGVSAQHTEPEAGRLSAHLLKLVVENDVDSEGRAILTDHGSFVLVNVYCPAFGREDQGGRAGFKKRFHQALTARCETLLRRGRQVLLVGDLNVTALPIDVHPVHRGRAQSPQAEYQQEQTKSLKAGLGAGDMDDDNEEKEWCKREWFHSQPFVDCFRAAWPTRQGAYTFWPTVSRARETNTGSRLDYILASAGLSSAVTGCDIQPDIMGSDHCPIYAELRPTAVAGDPPATLHEAALSALELPRLESLPPLCSIHLKRLRSQQTDLARYWQKADGTGVVGVAAADSPGAGAQMAAKRPLDSAPVGSAKSRRRKAQEQRGGMEAFLTVRRNGIDARARDRNGVLDEDAALKEAIRRSLADTGGADASMTSGWPPANPESTATPAPGAREAPGKTGSGRTGLGSAWDSVFNSGNTRVAPRCYHNEPAAGYETKDKRSEHFGRRFWACDDKRHPKGDWHCNPFPDNSARCPFFLWSQSHRGFVARGLDGKTS